MDRTSHRRTPSPAAGEQKPAKDTPESMAASNARHAIDGAIAFGRENRNPPPSPDHWLFEYWNIGRQLATLGATGWDNMTPMPGAAPQSHARPVAWVAVDERMPEGRYCLAVYVNSHGKQHIIRAMYVRQFEVEATGDECDSEYNEADDRDYLKAGWLECIDNWGEYSSVYVTEGTVTHWMPMPSLPAPPTIGAAMARDAGSGDGK